MKIPDVCPACKKKTFWLERTELNFDTDNPSRIDDQIFECDSCHTLFRVRWELKSFHQLMEIPVNPSERSKNVKRNM
jgi:hypothetical protein